MSLDDLSDATPVEAKDICCDCCVMYGEDVVTLCNDHSDQRIGLLLSEIRRLRACLIAVKARIDGEWDSPELATWGALTDTLEDILREVTACLEAGK